MPTASPIVLLFVFEIVECVLDAVPLLLLPLPLIVAVSDTVGEVRLSDTLEVVPVTKEETWGVLTIYEY